MNTYYTINYVQTPFILNLEFSFITRYAKFIFIARQRRSSPQMSTEKMELMNRRRDQHLRMRIARMKIY